MAYSFEQQISLDINWYFTDRFNRLCVAMSGGGLLPQRIAENEASNDEFHLFSTDLEERYAVKRNDQIPSLLELSSNSVESYFDAFEIYAKKGFYVFDRINLSQLDDPNYILVVYPIYQAYIDPFPISRSFLSKIPRIKGSINKSTKPFNLISRF
jgi:hypothetical protein